MNAAAVASSKVSKASFLRHAVRIIDCPSPALGVAITPPQRWVNSEVHTRNVSKIDWSAAS